MTRKQTYFKSFIIKYLPSTDIGVASMMRMMSHEKPIITNNLLSYMIYQRVPSLSVLWSVSSNEKYLNGNDLRKDFTNF